MYKIKEVLLLVAILNYIFASSCLELDEVTGQIVAGQVVSPDEDEIKINWLPVWDDNEGHNEFEIKTSEGDTEEGNHKNCNAPNGLGLQNLFQEARKLLPKEQIKAIAKSYSEDPEIKALKAFISNPKTLDKVKAIYNSQEYQILKDYSCRILHIDLQKYNKLARILSHHQLTRTDTQPLKGIRGFIREVNAVLPRQQLRELYKNLLASDEELAKAVENLKSKEFHQLLSNVKNNVPEYKDLRQQLIALGLPVEEMRELLANTLGWAPELGLFA